MPNESHHPDFPSAFDPKLFTPGPLTTSSSVKLAMAHDLGAWDAPLKSLVSEIRTSLLAVAGVEQEAGWECTLMQGSGSFGVESAIGSLLPREGRLAVVSNGAYGERMITIATMLGIDVVPIRFPETEPACEHRIAEALALDPSIRSVGVIHCETTTGIVNDIAAVGRAAKASSCRYIVDAMSSFGAYDIDLDAIHCDALISSANKCIEGVPGFSFVFARRQLMQDADAGKWPRSHSLDLVDQWKAFASSGKFRFTPPIQSLLAFAQALREFAAEGGLAARKARYQANCETLVGGMLELGFVPFLPEEKRSYIITTFMCPSDAAFDFMTFYQHLADVGLIIYPGKVTNRSCFRLGNIGRLFPRDMRQLVAAVSTVVEKMGFDPACDVVLPNN